MTNKEKKLWIERLKPFWKLREKAYSKLRKRELEIEKAMKHATGENLMFFYGEMHEGCSGIGHYDYERREKGVGYFPLIHSSELMYHEK